MGASPPKWEQEEVKKNTSTAERRLSKLISEKKVRITENSGNCIKFLSSKYYYNYKK
jgi:hypothetical protein